MTCRIPALALLLATVATSAQQALLIPPALDEDTFHLVVDEHVVQFYPELNTNTYGASAPYLGPTLILHKGDTAHMRVVNQLDDQETSMHWHGMLVPGEMDGGPPREVLPGGTWDVSFPVKNPAGTFWYHPHPHMLTAEQVNNGVAGMIIVRDEEEAALDLPRTYGVDDIPLVVQDRRFLASGDMVVGPFGDSVLVNGTPRPYVELPAQVVRLRLLNGSNSRIYQFGFEDDREFSIIANDGGMLEAPIGTDRLRLSNGERSEVLLDLGGMVGDSLLLLSYATELTSSMPGSDYILWEGSALNGIDFPILRIRVAAPTAEPVTAIPASLVTLELPQAADVSRVRHKAFSGNGMVGMGMFMINSLMFDMDVINDTMTLGATEEWNVLNGSDIAHPFHIHGLSFQVVDRDGQLPYPWEQGWKDVVLVDMAETVRLRMRYDELTNGWPFMYHCHNLMHEDNMMMLQFIVVDQIAGIPAEHIGAGSAIFPSPVANVLSFTAAAPLREACLYDLAGHLKRRLALNGSAQGNLAMEDLSPGLYVLELLGSGTFERRLVMKE